jgi:hypothetical protein
MKEVGSPDGQLRFRVPSDWQSTEESDGTPAYYDDRRTLRLKLMTFTAEEDLGAGSAYRELASMRPEPGQRLDALPGGNALRAHHEVTTIDGESTSVHVWLLASVEPPRKLRLALFSLSVPAEDARGAAGKRLVATLDQEIRSARFAHQLS